MYEKSFLQAVAYQNYSKYDVKPTATTPVIVSLKFYYIPINNTTFELSVFWASDTESRINELRFSDSISLSFKTRLTSVTCFCGDVT